MAPHSPCTSRLLRGRRRGNKKQRKASLMESPAHIFVVDDDTSSRELLSRILTSAGHRVTALSDGREALERLSAGESPDLVVSDIRMGDVDGLQLTDALRQRTTHTPLILITAFGNIDGAVDAIRRGAF